MHSLPLFVRLKDRPVAIVGEGMAADAKRRLLERAGARIVREEQAEALAIVVMEDDDAAQAAVARLRARGVLVNAVDRPALCDFTLPAIVDRDPVLIAVGTGGASAGLAKAVRQRIEALLPAGLGRLADGLATARNMMRARWPDAGDRRRAIDAALAVGGPLDPLTEHQADAVAGWLSASEETDSVRFVALQIASADPDDLTIRAARLLGQADVIYHHPDVPAAILQRARADAHRRARTTMPEAPENVPGLVLWLEMAS